ncbi:hypothetical protein CLOM_g24007 [Closterium sp. NIES-68]|nr:hypothetical protein CLOM_g24007 [Closterium sp. NIES-68]GJP78788.1 hypothetical protein CLOP_g9061 [Closterium sp. NIES-67]
MVAFLKAQQMEHIHSSQFIGISCDESTDRTRGKHLIVFGTFLKKRRVVTEFLILLTIDKEALAVKDASNSFPDLFIVDVIIRAFGEIVGRSTP